jgi:hypothetical protein
VKFVSYRDKARVYARKSNLKTHNRNTAKQTGPIYINEALTRNRAALFGKARGLVKRDCLDSCWTYDGRIYVKTIGPNSKKIIVKSENDLSSFDPFDDETHADDSKSEEMEGLGDDLLASTPNKEK